MPEYTPSVLAMLTEFFASDAIETTARQTGFVQRASKITGKLFLALITFGVWSEAKTTLGQLATKATQLGEALEVSPEALHQRMNPRALVFLQELLRQALAKVQGLDRVCEDGLFAAFAKVYLADSTGFGLPASLQDLFPGAGGSAAQAGAKIQAVWDYKNSVFGHFALTPWNIPDNRYVDTVVALAHSGVLFIFDLGYFKIKAFAYIAARGAYFLSRLNHQTHLFDADPSRVQSLDLTRLLKAVKGDLLEKQVFMGAIIGKYLSGLHKLDHVLVLKAGFETQLRTPCLLIPCGMRALSMTRQIREGRLQSGIQPHDVPGLQGLHQVT